MSEVSNSSYWCHMCLRSVTPVMDMEIKCPYCHSGFVEAMNRSEGSQGNFPTIPTASTATTVEQGDHQNLSGRRSIVVIFGPANAGDHTHNAATTLGNNIEDDLLRNPATSLGTNDTTEANSGERRGPREALILINPITRTIIIQETTPTMDQHTPRSLEDNSMPEDYYFMGQGIAQLLQRLAELAGGNYGTPPACKKAVEVMPQVTVEAEIRCSICLEDMMIGSEGREMPCKHRFHGHCILPWLKLHSSCPVCRFCMPGEEEGKGSSAAMHQESE